MIVALRHIVLFLTFLLVVFGESRAVGSGGSIINNDIFEAPDNATRLRYSKAWNHLDLAESGSKVDPAVITKLADDILDNPALETFLEGGVGRVKAWEILDDAGTALKTDVVALGKIDFLKSKELSDAQLIKIGQLDDIRVIDIADNLAKRTNPSVPINQIDLISSNAKALENVRPTIMDEISSMSSNSNLRNPDGLHSFLQNAKANSGQSGWKYELDVANEKLGSGSSIEYSKDVPKVGGGTKEVDILDYTASRIVEVKSYSSGNWTTIAKNLGDDVGVQIGSIDNAVKSQFSEHVGRVRIESSGHPSWYNGTKQDLIQEIQTAVSNPTWGAGVKANMDNMTHIVIENSTGIHTIEKALWQ